LPAEQPIGELSGGWRRRVGLAKALISKPDLLLLDEPTNHLDIVTIQWLENRIRTWPGAVLFITHDRAFLDKLATRICELDRGRLLSFPGRLSRLPGAQGKAARRRGHRQPPVRQEARRRGNLDPPGRQGAAAPQPEPRATPGGSCATSMRNA
jgi:ATPase subunit of ABC transporter with duplicated ATPase domains